MNAERALKLILFCTGASFGILAAEFLTDFLGVSVGIVCWVAAGVAWIPILSMAAAKFLTAKAAP